MLIGPFEFVDSFADGLAIFKQNGQYGFIDEQGEIVIPPKYAGVWRFSEGLAPADSDGDGYYGYIDTLGNPVIEEEYYDYSSFSEGRAVVIIDGFPVVINRNGDVIYDGLECGVVEIGGFSNGLSTIKLQDTYNTYMGYIDRNGKQIIPCDFDSADSFINGIARVSIDGIEFSIDLNGNRIGK